MVEYQFTIPNDNGNSAQKIKVDGKFYRFPNVFKKVDKLPTAGDVEALDLVPSLLEKLFVNISSPAVRHQGFYVVGHRAIGVSDSKSMNIDRGKKYLEDIPLVNTLSHIAGISVQKAVKESGELPKDISISVDMTTALPASEWNLETAELFRKRFEDHVHVVTVHVGHQAVVVTIRFNYVKVLQEGTPTLFTLIEDQEGNYRSDDIYDEFIKEYKLSDWDGEKMQQLTIFHTDIGDGSVEYITTNAYNYNPDFSDGEKRGIGHAIQRAAKAFEFFDVTRQEFVKFLTDENDKFHEDAVDLLKNFKKEQADLILEDIENRLRDMKYQLDIVTVYGGGSIQLKEDLYGRLKSLCDKFRIKLLWIPDKYADSMNVEGMDIYCKVHLPSAKKKALASKS